MSESSFLNPTLLVNSLHLHEGQVVADFGAGSGFFTRAAARKVEGTNGVVWAIDLNQSLLPRLKKIALGEGLHNVEVLEGDVSLEGGSHLPPQSIDMVFVVNTLFAVEDKTALVIEALRVLKKNGRVLVVDWRDSFGGLGPHPSHVITEAAAKKLFEAGGCSIQDSVPSGAYHWGFMAKKKVQ